MAKIYKGRNTLGKKAYHYLGKSWSCGGIIAADLFILWQGDIVQELLAVFYFLPLAAFFGVYYYLKKYKQFSAGAAGERALLDEVRRLPKKYHIFTNFMIRDAAFCDEVDFVIVSENGVIVIEGKNHCGKISGRMNDIEWKQRKIVSRGRTQMKGMTNPVQQTNRHRENLIRLLQKHGFYVNVQAVLVFTNPYAKLDVQSDQLPVIHGSQYVNELILKEMPQRKIERHKLELLIKFMQAQRNGK